LPQRRAPSGTEIETARRLLGPSIGRSVGARAIGFRPDRLERLAAGHAQLDASERKRLDLAADNLPLLRTASRAIARRDATLGDLEFYLRSSGREPPGPDASPYARSRWAGSRVRGSTGRAQKLFVIERKLGLTGKSYRYVRRAS
jgi:hypothetical protein